jgi:hypothetical protein
MTRRSLARALGLGLLALALAGCGYSMRGNLPDHIQTVAVPVFTNRTAEPGVENFMTSAVVEAFSTNGRLRVVGPENADSLLEGEVIGYALESIAFDRQANVRAYRLAVTMNLRFRDLRRNTILYEQQGLRERAAFQVQGAVSQTISREEGAVRAAAIDIARSIVSMTVERF